MNALAPCAISAALRSDTMAKSVAAQADDAHETMQTASIAAAKSGEQKAADAWELPCSGSPKLAQQEAAVCGLVTIVKSRYSGMRRLAPTPRSSGHRRIHVAAREFPLIRHTPAD